MQLRLFLVLFCLEINTFYSFLRFKTVSSIAHRSIESRDNQQYDRRCHFAEKKNKATESPLSQRWYREKQQHISKAQKRALRELWIHHGLDLKYGEMLSPVDIFAKIGYTVLDLGFGIGDSIIGLAGMNPNSNYLGCEIHRAGLGITLQKINDTKIENIKLIRADASLLLNHHLEHNSIDEVCIFFPDPWPTDYNKDRRIIRPSIISCFHKILKINGILRISTDVLDYSIHTKEVFDQQDLLNSTRIFKLVSEEVRSPTDSNPPWRPETKYASKAREEGRNVWDFVYILNEITT
eukprot:gene10677-22285_t